MAAPAYNYSNQPSAIAAVASEGLFTAMQLAADIPQVRRQLMARHNMQKSFFAMLKELGLGSPLSGPTFAHWEEDWIINNFLVGSVITASTGAGTNMVVQLDASSMYTTNIPGVGNQSFSYPAQWDIIKLPDESEAQIILKDVTTNPAQHRLTLRPRDSAVDLAGKVVANGRYFISTNAFGEGTYGATPKIPRLFRFSGIPQIVKSAFTETGSSMTNKLPVTSVQGQEGSYMIIGSEATEKLQYDRLSKALIFGKTGNNVTVTSDATGQPVLVKTTQGMDDFIENNGNLLSYASSGLDIDDFDAMGTIFERERIGTKNILLPVAYGLRTQISNTLKDYMNNTAFGYAVQSGGFRSDLFNEFSSPEDFFLWLDFSGIHKAGYNYLIRTMSELTEQMGAGTEGYNYSGNGYAIPVETFTNKDGSNATLPSIGYRYKELGGYSREMEIKYTGGAGLTPATTSLDAKNLDIRSEIGGEWALGNHMIKLTKGS